MGHEHRCNLAIVIDSKNRNHNDLTELKPFLKISLNIDDNQKDPNDYFDDGVRKIDFILVWTRSTKYEGKLKLTTFEFKLFK